MREQSCPHTFSDDTASLFCKVRKEAQEIMPRLNLSYPTRSPLHSTLLNVQCTMYIYVH